MEIGEKVAAVGKTQKGKNRVREHGRVWEVVRKEDSVPALGGVAAALLRANDGYERWVALDGDKDFIIEPIVYSRGPEIPLGGMMAVTLRQFLAKVERIKAQVRPEDLDKPVKLNVGNARWIDDVQRGEWGSTPELSYFEITVGGEPSIIVFGG